MKGSKERGARHPVPWSRFVYARHNVLERVPSEVHSAWVIFESQRTFALLEPRPQSRGHVLLVLKEPAATLLEPVSDAGLLQMAKDTQALTRALQETTACQGALGSKRTRTRPTAAAQAPSAAHAS